MLHSQNQACGFRPSEQASDVAQPTAKTHSTDFDPPALTLRALHKLIGGVGSLSTQSSPQACSSTQVTWHHASADTLTTLILHFCA